MAKINKEPEKMEEQAVAPGATAEAMLEMIINKEDEIARRIQHAEADVQRFVEEAKLDAAALRRRADSAEMGDELREKELEKANREARRLVSQAEEKAERVRTLSKERIEQAVKIVIDGVLPPPQGPAFRAGPEGGVSQDD